MIWSMIIWMAIVVSLLTLGFIYLNRRLIGTMPLSRPRKRTARVLLAVLFLVPFVSMMLFQFMESWGRTWAWVVYVAFGFLSLLLTSVAVRDLVVLTLKGYEFLVARFASRRIARVDASRRVFLVQSSNLVLLGTAGALTGYGVYQARRMPRIVRIDVPIQRLPQAFEGFRIVQVTDVHAGLTVRRDWIETVAQQVQDLNPDMIALTGDLVDGSVGHLRADVAPLGELTAPGGKFFVTGNHEYYSGVEQWVEEADRIGYSVLLNAHRLVEHNGATIVIAGVTDSTGGNFLASHASDPAKAIAGAPSGSVKILLAHQPRSLYEALPLGFDLQLSGHTHGGQFIPWNLLASLGQPYISGLHRHENTWVYVSRGTGYWGPPVRLGARSEITVVTLRKTA